MVPLLSHIVECVQVTLINVMNIFKVNKYQNFVSLFTYTNHIDKEAYD